MSIQRQDKEEFVLNKEYSGKLFGVSNSGEFVLLDNTRVKALLEKIKVSDRHVYSLSLKDYHTSFVSS